MSLTPKANYDLVVNREAIKQGISAVAKEITAWHKDQQFDKPPIALCMLNGGIFLFSELLLQLGFTLETQFLKLTTYDVETNTKLDDDAISRMAVPFDVSGRVVLVIDDICDTGNTLERVVRQLETQGAAKVCSVVLIDRSHVFSSPITPTFSALKVDVEDWLVGMGLDDQNLYRNLDQIYRILK